MSWDTEPVVGQWYRHLDKDYEFKVIAVDEDEGIVEIQYLDDEVEELDIDSWYEWDVERIAPYGKGKRVRGDVAAEDDVPEEEDDTYSSSLDEEEVDEDEEDDDELGQWEDR